jgi:hypothetical protein
MLELSDVGRRKNTSLKLSRMQTSERGDAEKEEYNGERVLFQPQHSRRVLRGGALGKDRGTAGAWDKTGSRPRQNGTLDPCGFTPT